MFNIFLCLFFLVFNMSYGFCGEDPIAFEETASLSSAPSMPPGLSARSRRVMLIAQGSVPPAEYTGQSKEAATSLALPGRSPFSLDHSISAVDSHTLTQNPLGIVNVTTGKPNNCTVTQDVSDVDITYGQSALPPTLEASHADESSGCWWLCCQVCLCCFCWCFME